MSDTGKGTWTLLVPMSPFATSLKGSILESVSWHWAVLDLVWGGEGGFRPDNGVPTGDLC